MTEDRVLDAVRTRVAKAIYDAVDPVTGDHIATTIHLSDMHGSGETIAEQLADVMTTCLAAADAAIATACPQGWDRGDALANAYDELARLRAALERIAHETRRQQLPITAQIHEIATDALNPR